MRSKSSALVLALLAFTIFSSYNSTSQEDSIRKKTEEYVEAYNRHDPKAVAALWAVDAEYTNPATGEVIQGRKAIEEALKTRFQSIGQGQLEVKIGSVTFPSNEVAEETGSFIVKFPDQSSQTSYFKIFYKNENGDWVIDRAREVGIAAKPDQYQHLKPLEWLIGQWIDEDEDVNITKEYHWDKSKNFIIETFSVSTEGESELDGRQIIVWDPIANKIRSFIFDSDGTFGQSTWTEEGDNWIVETSQTLANGKRASATNIFKRLNQNSHTWESTNRQVGDKLLPDLGPVTIQRKKG